ncbi:MAG: BolA/IbaG family iron-sulfur metabolism protein [Alphaproteobacteria bacterium]|nr:BolA/IbaG family iron-sulfur metabolism protein [Alphaproteobacteria bacterium]
MPMTEEEIERLIKDALPDAMIDLKDLRGDGDHFQAYVESREFIGKTRVQQHQMVYAALQGRVGGVLRALTLSTAIPQK